MWHRLRALWRNLTHKQIVEDYFVAAQLVDDRTDDCAFGAMMSPALRPKFRKLRFQMIARQNTSQRSLNRLGHRVRSAGIVAAALLICRRDGVSSARKRIRGQRCYAVR